MKIQKVSKEYIFLQVGRDRILYDTVFKKFRPCLVKWANN